jgi:hypothetical protein
VPDFVIRAALTPAARKHICRPCQVLSGAAFLGSIRQKLKEYRAYFVSLSIR